VRTVDAVIIGGGHNGLVAANLLADAGWEVLVLEATDAAGGAVQTAELSALNFYRDTCSAFYPLGAASPVLRALDLEAYGLAWRHAPAVLAHVLPDDRCALLSRDQDETAESLATFDARDGQAWREEVAVGLHLAAVPAAACRCQAATRPRRSGGPAVRQAVGAAGA
jgi:phytoene dehydrogenase-like protein